MYKKTHVVFFIFHFMQHYILPHECPGLCLHGPGHSYGFRLNKTQVENFEAFHWNISLITNLLFRKSDHHMIFDSCPVTKIEHQKYIYLSSCFLLDILTRKILILQMSSLVLLQLLICLFLCNSLYMSGETIFFEAKIP